MTKVENPIGFLLMELLQHYYWLDDALNSNLQRLGWEPVTRSQSLVLIHLATGVNRASIIARNIGVSRQAMSQILNEMRERKLVEFEPDPTDKRASIIRFCSESKHIRQDAVDILASIEAELARRIGRRSIRKLFEILEQDWGEIPAFEHRKACSQPSSVFRNDLAE